MAQVINNNLLRLRPKSALVEIPLLRFLADLNNLAHSYKELFQIPESFELFNVEFLENSIKSSGFKSFSTIKDDVLQIEVSPKKFQAMLTSIIVEASVKRCKSLMKDIDQLRSRYPTASSEPIIKPTAIAESFESGRSIDAIPIAESLASDVALKPFVDTPSNNDSGSSEKQAKEQVATEPTVKFEFDLESKSDEALSVEVKPEESKLGNVAENLMNTSLITDLTSQQMGEKADEEEFIDAVLEPELVIDEGENKLSDITEGDGTDDVQLPQTSSERIDSETSDIVELQNDKPSETSYLVPSEIFVDLKEVIKIEPVSENSSIQTEAKTPVDIKSESSRSGDEEEAEDGSRRSNRTRTHSIQSAQKRSASPLGILPPLKHKRFQSIAINLLKSIESHRFSSPFLSPVTAPDYSDTIKEATDLKSIMKAIKLKQEPPKYENLKELERDIMLMFANCVMFNKSSTPIVDMAKEMKDEVSKTFKMFEEAESTLNQ